MNTLTDLLYGTIYLEVFGNDASPYSILKHKLYNIDTDYFEKIPAWAEEIPEGLNSGLTEKVLADFNVVIGQVLSETFEKSLLDSIRLTIQNSFPNVSPEAIADARRGAMQKIRTSATLCFNYEPCPRVSDKELAEFRKRAERRTLGERILQSNNADVINYHHALMHKTVWDCKKLIDDSTLRFAESTLNLIA